MLIDPHSQNNRVRRSFGILCSKSKGRDSEKTDFGEILTSQWLIHDHSVSLKHQDFFV